MNKLIVEENEKKEIYLDSASDKYEFVVNKNAVLNIFHYAYNKSFNVEIYLKGENAQLNYFYSIINKDDNTFKITVHHDFDNTKSNLVNRGVNVNDKKLDFIVNGIIPKNTVGCNCTQDNKIMNLKDGKSSIEPNLLVDSFDAIANHAAYIGNFKEDVIFYLKSRGISQSVATKMLMRGFLLHDEPKEENIEDFLKQIDKL